jgi:hypothetical protein
MRFYYDRIYGKVDSDLLDRKDRFFEFCHQHSLPTVPIIYIAYGERSRQDEPKLPRRDLFSKPLNAFAGQGVALWTYDPDTDTWSSDNKSLPENDLIDYLNRLAENQPLMFAQILQPRVLNHPAVSGLSLRSLNTARIMTFRAKEAAPQIGISQFRMASDTSIVDTLHWYIASIETDTGRLGIGVSPNPSFPNCRVHPATGHAIEGVMLPQWQVAVQLVLRAHELAPPLPIIGWDVAFTPVGPLLVEANTCAVVKYVQLANGKSLATPEVVDALLSWLD